MQIKLAGLAAAQVKRKPLNRRGSKSWLNDYLKFGKCQKCTQFKWLNEKSHFWLDLLKSFLTWSSRRVWYVLCGRWFCKQVLLTHTNPVWFAVCLHSVFMVFDSKNGYDLAASEPGDSHGWTETTGPVTVFGQVKEFMRMRVRQQGRAKWTVNKQSAVVVVKQRRTKSSWQFVFFAAVVPAAVCLVVTLFRNT